MAVAVCKIFGHCRLMAVLLVRTAVCQMDEARVFCTVQTIGWCLSGYEEEAKIKRDVMAFEATLGVLGGLPRSPRVPII